MPRREKYVPTHRSLQHPHPRTALRRSLAAGGVAVAATALAVSSGVAAGAGGAASASLVSGPVTSNPGRAGSAPAGSAPSDGGLDLGRRTEAVSRSIDRTAVDPTKRRTLSQAPGGQLTQTEDLTSADPRTVARALLPRYGFGSDQFSCLDAIYSQESGWNVHADNPSSSAYGIPQALPGSKMASAGRDWADNPATQIRWGLGYIKDRYGSPCSAWSFKQGHGWY